jgi:hypothetical protein
MARGICLFVTTMIFAFIGPSLATDWEPHVSWESPISLKLDLPWASRGSYGMKWGDRSAFRIYTASWKYGPHPRIEVLLYWISPGKYWKRGPTLNESLLNVWQHLEENDVSKFSKTPCVAKQCATFDLNAIHRCGAFVDWHGEFGRIEAGGVSTFTVAYYCSATSKVITPEMLNEFHASLSDEQTAAELKTQSGHIQWRESLAETH